MTAREGWQSILWHMPGRVWAGMLRAGPLSLWFTAGAAMAWTLVSCGYVILFRPDLTPDHLFWIVVQGHGLVLVALVALTMTELSLKAGKEGIALDIGHDDRPPPPVATVTTTTTVEAPPAAATTTAQTTAPAKPDPAVNNEPMP